MNLEPSFNTTLQALSFTLFEKKPVQQLFFEPGIIDPARLESERFPLFEGLDDGWVRMTP